MGAKDGPFFFHNLSSQPTPAEFSVACDIRTTNDTNRPTAEQEQELVRLAKGGDQRAVEALIDGHMVLVRKFLRRYPRSCSDDYEELLQVGRVAVWSAIQDFDPKKARLSTHVFWKVKGAIKKATWVRKRQLRTLSLNVEDDMGLTLADQVAAPEPEEPLDVDRDILGDLEKLSPLKRRVVALVILDGRTKVEAARELGVSRFWVHKNLNNALRRLRRLHDERKKHD